MQPIKYFLIFFSILVNLLLSGCGSGGDDDTAATENGTLELAMTDAEEDFLTYRISVDSVSLKRLDGSLVELLPIQTEVDFVQYQELSELFAVLSVPSGHYESVVLDLDYSDAQVVVQDQDGNAQVASVVDVDGNPITSLSVELTLNDGETIHIRPRAIAQLTLDLDLSASNTIVSYAPAVVEVSPFLIGETFLDSEREHRVRGLLQSVDTTDATFALAIIPMRLRAGEFGTLNIHVNDSTAYEIDGVEYTGSAGLSALAALDARTPVVAFGAPSREEDVRFLATQVNAGSSVPWDGKDVLKGNITARSGNTLSIRGAIVETGAGAAHFRQDVTLDIDDSTLISGYRLGDADVNSLSIGQQIIALGAFDNINSSFDVSTGGIQMKVNRLVGQVVQASPLVLDLSLINRRRVEHFDFTGTGVDALSDADPESYEIDTSTLDLSNLDLNEWILVRGYPTAFGSAPMDFDATTLIDPDFSARSARFDARWSVATQTGVSVDNGQLLIDDTLARARLHLREIPANLVEQLSVERVHSGDNSGRFAIKAGRGGIHLYRDFDSFASELGALLEQGYRVHYLGSAGHYDGDNAALDAEVVTVHMTRFAL
jgi:hypothetical protein